MLQVHCNQPIRNTSGAQIATADNLVYLGAILAANGRVGSEIARRIGMAEGEFRTLAKVWKHTSLTRPRKIRAYAALVESRLLYGLATTCFTKAELRRLDGFQAQCLRVVLGIQPAHLSRVSNADVRAKASCQSASALLLRRQLSFFGKVARADSHNPIRKVSLVGNSLRPTTDQYVVDPGTP